MNARNILFTAIALLNGTAGAADVATTPSGELTVFTARKIITMEPALPEASAVAVADGRIVDRA